MTQLIWIILLLPLAGVVLNVLFGGRFSRKLIGWLAAGVVGLSFVLSLGVLLQVMGLPAEEQSITTAPLYTWAVTGDFEVPIQLLIDPLSLLMLLVVTGVGFLIHVYSIGYMEHDPDVRRYFVYLNLFVFSMLLLVLGANFVLLYTGWELVGLCSYLLISFWFTDPDNAAAGRKAFIVNRIGDFAFALGVFLIWTTFGSIAYGEVFEAAGTASTTTLTAITLLLFVGCTGKSAQLPLFTWLPDAMAGPTPVSALIHAATMVTAGVYLIARAAALFSVAPLTSSVVAWIGILTAIFAASIAIAQNDIKKVLAYSTISQLGYMFLGVGVGAYVAAIFHLFTHAFFKALLFLGAGSVIHAMEHGEHEAHMAVGPEESEDVHQDMRNMGGLLPKMPQTGWTFLAGSAALAGLPLTAGFFSKDEVLTIAFMDGHTALYTVGIVTALLTAAYSFRQFFMVFTGEPRSEMAEHAHESPSVMTLPLIVLALFAVGAGLVFGLPLENGIIHHWLEPVFEEFAAHPEEAALGPMMLLIISSVIALAGAGLAYMAYVAKSVSPSNVANRVRPLYTLVYNKYYVDELYDGLIVQPFFAVAGFSARIIDDLIIDGAVNGIGEVMRRVYAGLHRLQTGYVRAYALSMVLGALAVFAYLMWIV